MKKNKFVLVNKYYYSKVLDNGLTIYLIPNKNVEDYKVSLVVKYGSIHTNYKVGNNEYTIPNGTAHFLEHKIFERESGITPFEFFTKYNANCNAYTTFDHTCYEFSGNGKLKQNLNFFLDYIQNPEFTDDNVEKEKGIIERELLMYKDNHLYQASDILLKNIFKNSNYKYNIGGEVEDIYKITKDTLYNTYNTFYTPNNMYLIIAGNFNYKQALEIIENNQKNKTSENSEYKIINDKEPLKVYKNKEIIKKGLKVPIINIGYKLKYDNKNIEKRTYLSILLDTIFGITSEYIEQIHEKELIDSNLSISILDADEYVLLMLSLSTTKLDKLLKSLNNQLNNIKVTKEEFEIKKKVLVSKYINIFENNDNIMDYFIQLTINDEVDNQDFIEKVKDLKYENFIDFIECLSFDNYSIVVVN